MSLVGLLLFLHVVANVVWIGSILAVAVVATSSDADPRTRGVLSLRIYRTLAAPAFSLSFVAGAARLALDTGYYFSATKFMHGKLFFALVVIGLHHAIFARVKKMANGAVADSGSVSWLATGLLAAALVTVFFAVMKPF